MHVLICDDLKSETDKLAALLVDFELEPVVFHNGYDALEYVHSGATVDLCFLDIIMPEMSGVALAEQLRADGFAGKIVFLSTTNDYAHQSYRVEAFDYLLKPPTREAVKSILDKVEAAHKNTDTADIVVTQSGMTKSILLRDISHVEVTGHYVSFKLTNGEVVVIYAKFSDIAPQLLRDSRFVQCHRSYIVNMSSIATTSEREIIMRDGTRIAVSRGYPEARAVYYKWKFGRDMK